jgi:hypothetical protein
LPPESGCCSMPNPECGEWGLALHCNKPAEA